MLQLTVRPSASHQFITLRKLQSAITAACGAAGAISIQATDQGSQPTQINGIAGAAGYYAADANVATLNLTSDTRQNCKTMRRSRAGAVTIAANQQSNVDVEGHGFQGGVAAIGAVVAIANVTTNVNAGIGDNAIVGTTAGEVSSLSVATTTNNTVKSAARVGSGGVCAWQFRQCNGDRHFASRSPISAVRASMPPVLLASARLPLNRSRPRATRFHRESWPERAVAAKRRNIQGSLERVCRKRCDRERRQFVGHSSVNRHRGRPRPGFRHGPGDCRRV